MKLAIVGSRDIKSVELIVEAVDEFRNNWLWLDEQGLDGGFPEITEIVSGGARGTDRAAEEYAELIKVPCKVFEATDEMVRRYGPIDSLFVRNQQIVSYCDMLVAIRLPGKSNGTDDAVKKAKLARKPYGVAIVKVHLTDTDFFID